MHPMYELREARIREAKSRSTDEDGRLQVLSILYEHNWKPVDPDIIEARKIAADHYGVTFSTMHAWSSGINDKHDVMKVILAGIKRGRKLGEK